MLENLNGHSLDLSGIHGMSCISCSRDVVVLCVIMEEVWVPVMWVCEAGHVVGSQEEERVWWVWDGYEI